MTWVSSNLRKFFWEILAQAAQDFSTLIDWAIETLGVDALAVGECTRNLPLLVIYIPNLPEYTPLSTQAICRCL